MKAFLEWNAQWGQNIEMLLEIQEQTGEPPPALANRPGLDSRLMFFYEAYLEIQRSRQYSPAGDPRPLMLGHFLEYCQVHSVPREDWEWLWEGIETFDKSALSLHSQRVSKEIASKPR